MDFPGAVTQTCQGFGALGSQAGTGVTSAFLTLHRRREENKTQVFRPIFRDGD